MLISVIILLGVCFALFSTVTYTGVVVSSNSIDGYIEFTLKDEETNEQIKILADEHTDVYYCHRERDIYLGDLMDNAGSTVEVTCKRFFNHINIQNQLLFSLFMKAKNMILNIKPNLYQN